MNSSIEVVVVCVTGMVCDAIADALECDSIKVKTRASTIADIDAAQLKDTVVIYIWGGGDDEFAADEATLMADCDVKSWIVLSQDLDNPIIENLIAAERPVCTAPISICRDDLRHLICLAERNARVCIGPVSYEKNALATQMLKNANLGPDHVTLLRYLSDGLSNKEIARAKDCTEGTVKVHIRQLMLKLGVANRTQAAVLAVRAGLSSGTAFIDRIAGSAQKSLNRVDSRFEDRPFAASRTANWERSAPPTLKSFDRGRKVSAGGTAQSDEY
tara:strand:- start:1680 stop:2498 length:819 start_codon:yes stop_codon:yes gene_type:complete